MHKLFILEALGRIAYQLFIYEYSIVSWDVCGCCVVIYGSRDRPNVGLLALSTVICVQNIVLRVLFVIYLLLSRSVIFSVV